jgi:hypothetical protein
VDYENGKGLIQRVTVTDVERLSKRVGCEEGQDQIPRRWIFHDG